MVFAGRSTACSKISTATSIFPSGDLCWPTPESSLNWGAPAVDITEKDTAYEVTAELPGMDEKNLDVTVSNGMLTIKGEKR